MDHTEKVFMKHALGILKSPAVGVVSDDACYPVVCNLQHIPTSVEEVDSLMAKTQVCISTSAILGRSSQAVQERFATHCPYLFIDEAHHVEAPTWTGFKRCFANSRIVQFTATPFREDGKQLEGKIVFRYPLHKAQEEEYFRPIKFETVHIYDKADADEAIAEKAVACLRANWDSGQVLMARVSTVKRARQIFPLYGRHADLNAIEMHTGLTIRAREAATKKLLSGEARVVVCVDMLGEGFDMPELKIAAFHDIRKSLAITLQLAGRFTRVKEGLGDATFIANVADVDVQKELKKLYTQDPDWNKLLPEASHECRDLQNTMHGMEPGKLPGRHSPNPRLFASPPHGKCKRERLDYRYNETPSSPLDRRAESTFRGVGTLRGLLEPIRQPVVHQQLWKQWRVRSTCEGYRRGRCLVDYRRSLVPGVRGAFFGEVPERWFDGDVGPKYPVHGPYGRRRRTKHHAVATRDSAEGRTRRHRVHKRRT
jgi:hypothetical protein